MSLGVFLFGYDQGVMSGIITSVFLSKDPSPWLDPCWGYNANAGIERGIEAGILRNTSINHRGLKSARQSQSSKSGLLFHRYLSERLAT